MSGCKRFFNRPIEGEWRYLWLDATYLRQREGGRVVSVAAIIAVAVRLRRQARDCRLAYRSFRGRAVLVRLSQEPGPARAQGREAGGLGRPSRAESGDRAGVRSQLAASPVYTGCAMRWRTSRKASTAWWRRHCGRPFCSRITLPLRRPGVRWPIRCVGAGPNSAR